MLRREYKYSCEQPRARRPNLNDWATWLDQHAAWTHAATFTCRRHTGKGFPITDTILKDTARHYVTRVNRKCFGKTARSGKGVTAVGTFGWGTYDEHPHLHLSFACPKDKTFDDFVSILNKAADRIRWFDRQRLIKPYRDLGWMTYMVRHGTDQVLLDLTPSSHHLA